VPFLKSLSGVEDVRPFIMGCVRDNVLDIEKGMNLISVYNHQKKEQKKPPPIEVDTASPSFGANNWSKTPQHKKGEDVNMSVKTPGLLTVKAAQAKKSERLKVDSRENSANKTRGGARKKADTVATKKRRP